MNISGGAGSYLPVAYWLSCPQLLFIQGLGLWISKLSHNLDFCFFGSIIFTGFSSLNLAYCFAMPGGSILQTGSIILTLSLQWYNVFPYI